MSRIRHLLPFLLLTLPLLIVVLLLAIHTDINGYLVAFGLSCYLLAAALVFYHLDAQQYRQTGLLSDLLDALIDGDYTLRGKDLYTTHFQSLLERVNRLAQTLQSKTVALKENQLLLQQVIDSMNASVLAIDSKGRQIFANQAARNQLNLTDAKITPELIDVLIKASTGQSIQLQSQWCSDLHPGGEFLLQKDSFISQGQSNQLMVLSEVGQLLHNNEAAAWQRLVRVISHELNNSMAPVNTISRTILRQSEQHQLPENFVQGLGVIQERCEHMMGFVSSYSKISQLPLPNKSLVLIKDLLHSSFNLFGHRQITLIGETEHQLFCDRGQIQQVLINLLKNADEATEDKDAVITFRLTYRQKQIQMDIEDKGCGISNKDNLFVPFYTTKQQGSGIGLMLSQQIINNHHGQLMIDNNKKASGTVATILLPYELTQSSSEKS